MKRLVKYTICAFFVLTALNVSAQGKRYTAMFYNLENLYDTIKSPDTFDDEFTPNGSKSWTGERYWKKIANIEKVLYSIAADTKGFPAIIGVSEIENRSVLEDVVAAPKLQAANYQIVHYDSPDARGVDVAMFYRPSQFKLLGSKPIPVHFADEPRFKTRDILMAWGEIEGELFYVFVNHWPSRLGGQAASEYKRVQVAQIVKHNIDSVLQVSPQAKIMVMGDLNDDPTDKSMFEALGAKGNINKLAKGDMYNPFYDMFKKGFGTLAYNDAWNLFDNIIVNYNLVDGKGLKLYKPEANKYYGNIFDRQFLRQQSGQYKNYPLRTFVGSTFTNGYSDHFPVFIYIAK